MLFRGVIQRLFREDSEGSKAEAYNVDEVYCSRTDARDPRHMFL